MADRLNGCVLLLAVADGVDGKLVDCVRTSLRGLGARIHLAAPGGGAVRTLDGSSLDVDADLRAVHARYYDAVVLPAGQAADVLSKEARLGSLLRDFHKALRPIGALAEGAGLLAAAGISESEDAVVVGVDCARMEPFIERLAKDIDGFRRRDYVEETSVESFPASDSPGGNAAI